MKTLKALIVEDSTDDVALLVRHLSNEGYDVQPEIVQTAADLKVALGGMAWDVILSDYSMPHFTGLDALQVLKKSGLDIPFIIISGTIGEDIGVEAMVFGANDYLMKGNLTRLAPAIEREMENAAGRRDQKQAENELLASKALLINFVTHTPAAVAMLDMEMRYLQVSRQWLTDYNLEDQNIIGKTHYEIFPDVPDRWREVHQRCLAGAVEKCAEDPFPRSDGTLDWLQWESRPWYKTAGEIGGILFFTQVITKRKRAEEDLEKSVKRERAMIENSLDVIFTVDAAGKFVSVSPASLKVWGYQSEELIGRHFIELVVPEDVDKTNKAAAEIMSGIEARDFENCFRHKTGSRVAIRWTAFWSETDQLIFSIAHDSSEQKRMEEERKMLLAELASEKARLQHIFDNSPSFIVSLRGPDFVFEIANPAYYKLVGQRELIGIPVREALPELLTQDLPEILRQVYQTGEPFIGNEMLVKLESLNGSEPEQHYINFVYLPLREADNSISGIVSYGIDVTEQVLAKFKLQESEERYRVVAETANDVIITIDEHSSILYANPAVENILGYKPSELIGNNLSIIVPERLHAAHKAGISRYIQTDRKNINWKDLDLPVLHRNGREIRTEISFGEYRENNKRFFAAVIRDITERKRAEEIILESEEKYRSIVETANEGIWLTDLETRAIYVNRQMAEMLGYTVDEMLGRPIFDFIFDDDLADAKHKYVQRKSGKSETGEFRMRRKDGSELITLYNTTPRRNQAGEIVGFLSMRSDISESKKAEREIQNAEYKYRNLVESSPAIVYLTAPQSPYVLIYVSPNISRFGYTTEEWFSQPDLRVNIMHKDDREEVLRATEDAIAWNIETDLEYRIVKRDKTIIWIHEKGRFVFDEQGNKTGWQGVMVDITKTKELEEQLRQSQKLESVGRLAGGIAHDFNNMLTAINGYSELTLRKLDAESPLRRNIEEIKKAGERSAMLTHQLLAFSRQQVLKPVVLDLNEVIIDMGKMLERLIGEDIELVTILNSKTGHVNVDPGQLSQIIMNLAVNARDAMPQGGKLTIETSNIFIEPADASQKLYVLPGAYVMMAFCDTGNGIDESIQPHIFEPFYTTKEIGKGTGLGLATVYGIVKQSGGSIEVSSRQEIGTTFNIYLPRVLEEVASQIKQSFAENSIGKETILLVEDEELVRNLSKEILENRGYTVIEAGNGAEALEICENEKYRFDLLMTDVVMPQMGGRELAWKLAEKNPKLKILFTSGYTDDAMVRQGINPANTNFLQKPFTFEELAHKVRELLDE